MELSSLKYCPDEALKVWLGDILWDQLIPSKSVVGQNEPDERQKIATNKHSSYLLDHQQKEKDICGVVYVCLCMYLFIFKLCGYKCLYGNNADQEMQVIDFSRVKQTHYKGNKGMLRPEGFFSMFVCYHTLITNYLMAHYDKYFICMWNHLLILFLCNTGNLEATREGERPISPEWDLGSCFRSYFS